MREFDRRKVKRADGVRSRHPRIGGFLPAVTEEPQTTKNWARGAVGEQKVGAILDGLSQAGVVALHDRLRGTANANIDHLAITPSGVWVIDPKRYQGEVRRRDVGGWLSTDIRLYVGRRDCSELLAAMDKQVAAVRKALGTEWDEIPVRPILCFLSEWPLFSKPFELEGVLATWPKAMRELIGRPGPYDPATVQLIAARLDERLRPAS